MSLPSSSEQLAALRALQKVLGESAVLIGDAVPERNWNDWSTQAPQRPLAVIRPMDAQGVSQALRACRQVQLPVLGVRNALDPDFFRAALLSRDDARKALGLAASSSLLLGAVGRLVPEKGFVCLLQAIG